MIAAVPYDGLTQQCLQDYAAGSRGLEGAIAFAVAALPSAARVLDVGCGIGWSSFEIARHHPEARILGIDSSPHLIAAANALFGEQPRVRYEAKDVFDDQFEERFDAVVLLDPYGGVAPAALLAAHERLAGLLEDDGTLVVAARPEDARRLAADLGGRVTLQPDRSVYALIERGAVRRAEASVRVRLESPRDRATRIRRGLGLRWTRGSGFVADRGGPRICIATSWPDSTFIRAHIERLPGRVHVLAGEMPHRADDGRSVLPPPLRATARLLARPLRAEPERLEDRLAPNLPASLWARRYARYLRQHEIDVVLAESGTVAASLHEGCRRAGVPLVAHFHGFDAFMHDVLESYGDAYRAIFAEGDPVVAVSTSMKRQLQALGAGEGQVSVNPCGVDLTQFRPGQPTKGLVISVGRFVDKKAPELALLAFSKALRRVPSAQLLMLGDGPLRPAVERLVAALHLEDNVRLEGGLSHREVVAAMVKASVFIQHSVVDARGDRGGTPVAVLEAGAAGLPVVATRHEGIAEVVVDRETGILVDEHDTDAMGAAIAELLSDPQHAQALGRAARRRVETDYSMELSIRRLGSVLESAIPRTAASSRRRGRASRERAGAASP